MLASLLLGASVMLITLALWPGAARAQPVEPRFVEDERVPRTLH